MTRVLLALAVASLSLPLLAQAGVPVAGRTTVAVTITDSHLTMTQTPVHVGTVFFRVADHAHVARDFGVAGQRTPRIAPGRTATLTVAVTKSGLSLLSSSGPPGSVPLRGVLTFIDFHVEAAAGGDGPSLQPGQTASSTVRLTTKGKVFYRCIEPEHDEMYGETGWLTVG